MDIYDNCFWFLCHSNSGVYVECEGKEGLKPVQYLSYKKGHFYRDFTFTCEACGTRISSAQERCPSCGGVYGANKEYVKKKHAMNLKGMHAKCYIMQLELYGTYKRMIVT